MQIEAKSLSEAIQGSAGRIAMLIDTPLRPPIGIAVIGHPQPLVGGSPRHPVPSTIAKAAVKAGWLAVRPSFRGVGSTEGEHTEGAGEAVDIETVVLHMRRTFPDLPVVLIGFSFGAFVFARTALALEETIPASAVVLLGMPIGDVGDERTYPEIKVPANLTVIHGGLDQVASLQRVIQWCTPSHHPVIIIPGSNHAFKGALPQISELIHQELKKI